MIGDYLDEYSFENLIKSALERVPDTIDKREGSIIYDALSPACYELAEYYMRLKQVLRDTYIETAVGKYLDLRVIERGLTRIQATYAIKKATFETENEEPKEIDIGSRFSTISDTEAIIYKVIDTYRQEGNIVEGSYLLECEEIGTVGNAYVGSLIPLSHIQGLANAIMTDLIVPARDIETDDKLRERYFKSLEFKPFGGNLMQYREWLKDIAGVGEVQIYVAWDGGGTVKCSIIDTNYNKISSEFIQTIQDLIDPTPQAEGLGLAPIGHEVTITTPTEKTINIETIIKLFDDYTLADVRDNIENSIENYLLNLRKNWGIPNAINQYAIIVYLSQLNAAILNVEGIENVASIKINGDPLDLELIQNNTLQELPVKGMVTLNEL